MPSTRSSRLLLLALAFLATACGGTRTLATYNTAYAFAIFAISGAPASAPTAIKFFGGATVANASFDFDVAVDIDSAGATRLYPVRTLAGGLATGTKRIGLQVVPATTFEGLREAPATGYDTLGSKVVVPGSVVAVELQDIATCLYSLSGSTILHAKLVVDSIKPAARRVFGRTVVDPNCGFYGLLVDTIPTR
jgi:hypothetical protein